MHIWRIWQIIDLSVITPKLVAGAPIVFANLDYRLRYRKKNQYKLTQKIAKDIIHGHFKGGRCIGEAKRHDQELKVAINDLKFCLERINKIEENLVVAWPQFQFGEHLKPIEFVQ